MVAPINSFVNSILPSGIETTPQAEGSPATKTEKPATPELQPIPSPAPQPQKKPAVDDTTTIATQPKTAVVDKSKEKVKLHHIKETTDKLTTIADEEEEEFIENVEAAHGQHN